MSTERILSLGAHGADVLQLKKDLNQIGAHLVEDETFDSDTLHAVYNVQRAYKLLQDGRVGPLTRAAIKDALLQNGTGQTPTHPTGRTPLIDIYHGDSVESFSSVLNAGYLGVIHKASDGNSFVDVKVVARSSQIRNAGLLFGTYLFYRPGVNPVKQVDLYLRVYSPIQKDGDIPPSFDFGEFDVSASSELNDAGLVILEKMQKETGLCPMVYGAMGLLSQYKLSAEYAKYPVWIADPNHTPPRIPAPWKNFAIHQNVLDTGTVPGINNGCDTDYYNGSLDEFKKFISDSKV